MLDKETALLLIGFQNDYFAKDGILNSVFEDTILTETVIDNTCNFIEATRHLSMDIIETPIKFTEDYQEIESPIGILKLIKDKGAFKEGTYGSATVEKIAKFSADIESLPGKRGLNCFSNTLLHESLQKKKIKNLIIAGAVTSLCIDTAGREAMDLGYKVTILSDCILSRTGFEQKYYIEEIMPLYSKVSTSKEVAENIISNG